MNKLDRIKELVVLLNKAGKSYYSEGREIMSNYEYDKLYDELKKNALKLWEYAIHLDTLGERETAVLKQIMM